MVRKNLVVVSVVGDIVDDTRHGVELKAEDGLAGLAGSFFEGELLVVVRDVGEFGAEFNGLEVVPIFCVELEDDFKDEAFIEVADEDFIDEGWAC